MACIRIGGARRAFADWRWYCFAAAAFAAFLILRASPGAQPLSAASPPSSRAVVSLMMSAQGKNESQYTDCLVLMIDTLRAAGWRHDILVLATHDARAADVERVRALGVTIMRVSTIAALSSSNPSTTPLVCLTCSPNFTPGT